MKDLLNICYTNEEILSKRNEIALRLTSHSPNIKGSSIIKISNGDLQQLFSLYDEIFLGNRITQEFKGIIKFSLSSRLTKTAGKTLFSKSISQLKPQQQVLEIRIGTDFFFKYDELESEKSVAGIVTHNALEALQLVFEHELCHVIEFIMFGSSSCSQPRFKALAGNIFGHTESTHQLPTSRKIAQEKYGIKIGDKVSFAFEGQKLEGVIYRINKRATVMVKDRSGAYADKQGKRYTKYYVPLSKLQ